MALVDAAVVATHLLFAGLWTGSVLFVTAAVVPVAARGDLDATPLSAIAGRLRWITRASAVVLFLTGGHLAASRYTAASLTGTTGGYLVLAMLALWFVLAGLVEAATGRLVDGANERKVREPARRSRRLLQAASVVALLLLVDAGLLASGL